MSDTIIRFMKIKKQRNRQTIKEIIDIMYMYKKLKALSAKKNKNKKKIVVNQINEIKTS